MLIRHVVLAGALASVSGASVPATGAFAQQAVERTAPADRVAPPGGQLSATSADAATRAELATPIDAGLAGGGIAPARSIREAQLHGERATARVGTQLSDGVRTAQSSEPLSTPAQGRRQSVVRLGGKDRCDPRAGAGPIATACAHVIETRAADFAKPSPLVLSPEQRLIVDQRLRDAPASAQAAVERIGRNDVDPAAADAQSVASLVIAPATGTRDAEKPASDTGVAPTGALSTALIQAIVEGRTASPTGQ